MLFEISVLIGSAYAGTKVFPKKQVQKSSLASSLAINPTLASQEKPIVGFNQLTRFQSEQIDPILDKLYAKGEAFVQNRIAVKNKGAALGYSTVLPAQYPSEITPAERSINRSLTEMSMALAVNTVAPLVYPPLMWLSVPILLKQLFSMVQKARSDVSRERNVGISTMIAIGETSLFLLQRFWLASFFGTLYMCSEKFLYMTRDTSQRDLADLWGEMPRVAWCKYNGVEVEVPIEQLQVGDEIIVHAGEMIPVDGMIVSGFATIDQHMLTGEAQPIEKSVEDLVYAGTIILAGEAVIGVEHAGAETVTGQIGEVLRQTADYRSTAELRGEKIANASVLPTLALGAATWGLFGPVSATALLSCFIGFQLRYTGPLSILNFLQIAAKEGILIKDGRALELVSQVDTIVFDKTGTLTLDQLTVGKIHASIGGAQSEFTAMDVLRYAAAAEYKQTHPIARAILQEANECAVEIPAITDAAYTTGFGLEVTVEGPQNLAQQVYVGSERYMALQQISIPEAIQSVQNECHQQGHSLVYIAVGDQLAGVIELQPIIRPEAREIVASLKARGMELYIISGDQAMPTQNLANKLGIDHYFAEVLPEEKAKLVSELQRTGKSVCFIGDGINDSIALKQADASISLRGATTMAMDTAQMILTDGTLRQLPKLFAISDKLESNMQRNFLAATVPGIICLGGVFFLHFGIFTACLLSWTGLSAGIANASQPLLRYKQQPERYLLDAAPLD